MKIKVFDYIDHLDCFVVRKEFKFLMERLGLSEWNPVVWLGRLFFMDNDFGEHWFDNWDERDAIKTQDFDSLELMIVVPEKFIDKKDGPCHTDAQRKRFWTDVLDSLSLDLNTIFEEARENNREEGCELSRIGAIEPIIERIKNEYYGS